MVVLVVVNVYLPRTCRGVLFIENQDSYALACEGRPPTAQGLALVYAAGFRGTAARLRQRDGVRLHYAGAGQAQWQPRFEAWWFEQAIPFGQTAFWGDLDFAGMGILRGLRQRFGDVVAWESGYRPLLDHLRNSGGHALQAASKQNQIDPKRIGCEFADQELLPAIRLFGGVDQELLG
ncbi:MAG: Wadjet anti-phage system protein JetD domain-containing protein [Candidatus Thiodiazotropha sp. 6PLUC7]